ncbi:hypothetical protein ATANTOWER_007119 [Ataeniobius toweri]|uniref:Uncharacterized protein n=1 Tax=Ataeniobius toweri TaxID=208326 RepID=A0ABU7CIJ1_9TELE|nr:hypothetical protein [Ataeniobius toweri]
MILNDLAQKNRSFSCFSAKRSEFQIPAGSLHVLPVNAWVLSGCFVFLSQSKSMTVRSTGLCARACVCVCVCVSECTVVCSVQGGPASQPSQLEMRATNLALVFFYCS